MKMCFISAFPPEKEGEATYSFYLVKSIERVCNDCTINVMARLPGHKPTVMSLSERVKIFRIWKMRSLRSMMQSIIAIIKVIVFSKPNILHIQYYFVRAAGGSVGEPFLILMLALKIIARKLKLVVTLHTFWLPGEVEQRVFEVTKSRIAAKLYRLYYEAYARIMLTVPDLIISLVSVKRSPITQVIRTYTKREVAEVLHGLPHVRLQDRDTKRGYKKSLGVDDKFTILLFGFIRKAKGYEYIIKAIQKIVESKPSIKDKIRVILTGVPISPEDQAYLNFLNELIWNLRLKDTILTITKYLNNNEVDTFFRAADVTVLPYTRRVGPSGVFSFVLAYEVPSIITCDNKYITRRANLPALVVDLNADEIASAILKLMTDKNEYAKQIQRIKQYKVINSNQKIALLHVKLYRKLCSGNIIKQ